MGTTKSPLERLVPEALRLGADALEVEYRHGYEEVVAMSGCVGAAIASLRSGSSEAALLRDELNVLVRRKRRLTVGGDAYELQARAFESFGERAYRVEFPRVATQRAR